MHTVSHVIYIFVCVYVHTEEQRSTKRIYKYFMGWIWTKLTDFN